MCKENLGCLLTERCTNELNIRADDRKKFAEWCKKNNIQCRKKVDGEWIQFSVSEIIADFEKEQK